MNDVIIPPWIATDDDGRAGEAGEAGAGEAATEAGAGEAATEASLPSLIGPAGAAGQEITLTPFGGSGAPRYDKHRVDLVAVATAAIGRPPDVVRGDTSWWRCPVHAEATPSFFARPGRATYACRGCGWWGDAVALVQELVLPEKRRKRDRGYKAAVRWLADRGLLDVSSGARRDAPSTRGDASSSAPKGKPKRAKSLSGPQALEVLKLAHRRLRDDSYYARLALKYLKDRGLTRPTIDRRQLGFLEGYYPSLPIPGQYGIVVPWAWEKRIRRLMYRRLEDVFYGVDLKVRYFELYRDDPLIYPSPGAIRDDLPLVIVEGELDAVLLGQELVDLAAVVTVGSASERPGPDVIELIRRAPAVYLGLDADPAGEKAAERWQAEIDHAIRIRPPAGKDWTEAGQAGTYLRGWWGKILDGGEPASPIGTAPGAGSTYETIDWRAPLLERPF